MKGHLVSLFSGKKLGRLLGQELGEYGGSHIAEDWGLETDPGNSFGKEGSGIDVEPL